MLTQVNQSLRGPTRVSLVLSILCQVLAGKFYIGKLREEVSLVHPPDLLPGEGQSR